MNAAARKKILILTVITVYGITIVVSTWGFAPDYTSSEITAYTILGLIIFAAGTAVLAKEIYRHRHSEQVPTDDDYSADADTGRLQIFISRFYKDYSAFYRADDLRQNMPLQSDCTQLYYNMVGLHHNRLDRLGISLRFSSAKRKYSDEPCTDREFTDGNYTINDISQELEAVRNYYRKDKTSPFFVIRSRELSHMTVLSANTAEDGTVVCPGCGCRTTRENLLDGCDFCGTRFVLEDLDGKVSAFAMRDNADFAYEKYKSKRIDRAFISFLIADVLIYVLIYLGFLLALTEEYVSDGDPLSPLFLAFSFMGVIASFSSLAAGIWEVIYIFAIFPLMEVKAAVSHHSKKNAELIREQSNKDKEITEKIKEIDPLFSLETFYLNMQNKLMTLVYADSEEQANAFSRTDLSGIYPKYKDVFDTEVQNLRLESYECSDGLQKASVDADMVFYCLSGKKVKIRTGSISLDVVKSESCKTQSVCAPYVLRCPSCGDSLSLTDGMICRSCGRHADLISHDWVIDRCKIN